MGEHIAARRFKAGITEAMRIVSLANKYLSDQEPWKLKDDPARRDTVLHVALQVVSDCNTLLTPYLPHSAQAVFEALGNEGVWAAQPELREVTARLPRPGLNAGLQSHRGLSACSGALRARTPKPGFCRLRAALPAALYFSSPFLAWGARRGSQAAHDSGRPARDESDAAAMMRVISSCHACSAC